MPSATFARRDGHAKSVLSPFRRVLTTLQAVCLAVLCMPACEMVKREAVCTAHGSTADALRRDLDAANERDAPPEAAERAAATIRASAKPLDQAAGVPAVDGYKQAMLKLADEYERRARENEADEAEAIGMAYAMEFQEKAVAFYTWCRG